MAEASDSGDPVMARRARPSVVGAMRPSTASTASGPAGTPGPRVGGPFDSSRQLEETRLPRSDHPEYLPPGTGAMGAFGSQYPAREGGTSLPASQYPPAPGRTALPTSSAAGERLVAAMENVDRVVSIFLEDLGRAVASVRHEVASEREFSLRAVNDASDDTRSMARQVLADREDFERHRQVVEVDLEKRWADLRKEQESDKKERARVEREIREMSQRATSETQAAALVQMQAAQAAHVASLRMTLGGDLVSDYGELAMATGYGDLNGMGAGLQSLRAGQNVAQSVDPFRIPNADPPEMASPSSRTTHVHGGGTGYFPTENGLQNHPSFPPPGDAALMDSHRQSARSLKPLPGPSLVFAIGGLATANAPLCTGEVYEPENDTWRPLPEMSTARGYLAVALGGARENETPTTLLAIGGSDGRRTLRSCEEFCFEKGAWREVAPMSVPRIWLGSATIGERTYAVGGYDGTSYLDIVEAFVPGHGEFGSGNASSDNASSQRGHGRWERCSSLSNGRSTCGVAAVRSTLYCVGGYVLGLSQIQAHCLPIHGLTLFVHNHRFSSPHYLSIAEAYDPTADRWWGISPLRSPRRDLGACSLAGRGSLVVAGGYDGNSYLSKVEALDPRMNGWRALAPLKTPQQLIGLVSAGDTIFAIGGFDGRETTSVVEVYDAIADRWHDSTPMSAPRLGLGACCV